MLPRHPDVRVQRLVDYFEQLDRPALDRLGELYTPDAGFKDPFNEVTGLAALRAIFQHMFDTLHAPRFAVTRALAEGDQAFLVWRFSFALRPESTPLHIDGGSLIVFAADGRVCRHRDYWDAAEELYEKLPVLGVLMRWLRRRLRVPLDDRG